MLKKMGIKYNKKGLSSIVATVLIILLVVVAVAIIWAAVKPTIQNTTGQIGSSCLTISTTLDSCVLSSGTLYNISMTRGSGEGDLKAIKFIFNNGTGDTKLVSEDASDFGILGTKKFTSIDGTLTNANVDYALVVVSADGTEQTCEAQKTPVDCK